jgi:hypothetical protein
MNKSTLIVVVVEGNSLLVNNDKKPKLIWVLEYTFNDEKKEQFF